jgi:hypothetical protein
MCVAKRHVCFTPNSDRESGYLRFAMSALPPKADMCSAMRDVRFGPIADIRATYSVHVELLADVANGLPNEKEKKAASTPK